MSQAFIFPGQASQKVGMGIDLYSETELGKRYFDQANEIMGIDLKDITFNGPEDVLTHTRYTQPAIYTVSVILGELLLQAGIRPAAAAGHSLGEYSALTIAGAFDFASGLELVKLRAASMQSAGENQPGTMAAIIGLTGAKVDEICKSIDTGIVVVANYNTDTQIVISGEIVAVKLAMEAAAAAGAMKTVELNVSGAFHSPLMMPARDWLQDKLDTIEISDLTIPLFANVTAQAVTKADEIRQLLVNQLENPVRWNDSILNMAAAGITDFIEVGPGRVLQGLLRRIDRKLNAVGIEFLTDIEKFNNA